MIVALSEKSRSHIPYRNSMMTSVLRDSLGGNCMTTMIATCSIERTNIDVSLFYRHAAYFNSPGLSIPRVFMFAANEKLILADWFLFNGAA